MCKRTIASSCCLFVCFEEGFASPSTDFRIFGDLLLDWWTLTKLRTLEKKIIPIDLTSDISIACLQAYIVFWKYEHWISSCNMFKCVTSIGISCDRIDTDTGVFLFVSTVIFDDSSTEYFYVVLTFAIRKADLSFLPNSKHIRNCFCSALVLF